MRALICSCIIAVAVAQPSGSTANVVAITEAEGTPVQPVNDELPADNYYDDGTDYEAADAAATAQAEQDAMFAAAAALPGTAPPQAEVVPVQAEVVPVQAEAVAEQPVDNYFADDAEQYIDTNVQELDVELEADWWTTDDELSAAAGEWFNEDVMPFFSIHKDEVFGNAMAKAEATHGPLMETCGADGELCMSKINDKLVTDL